LITFSISDLGWPDYGAHKPKLVVICQLLTKLLTK